MTQPDRLLPAPAFNYSSIAALAARTAEDIEAELYGRSEAPYAKVLGGLFADLPTGMPLPLAILTALARKLLKQPTRVWESTTSLLVDIQPWVENIPSLGDIVELLTGIEDGDENDLGTFFLNLRKFFQSIDFADPDFDPAVVHKAFVETVVQPFIKTITQITSALLGPLSIGFLTDEIQTLLFEGGFDDPVTLVEADGITHDATDGVPGSNPLGCARVACDGTYKMRWSELIKVGKGWSLKAGAQVAYESLVATAGTNAVRVELQPYKGESNAQPMVIMAADESAAGTVPWGGLDQRETYVVPTDVTHVAIGWGTTEDATSGVVKFDNVYLDSIEKLPQSFTKDLPEDLQTLVNEALALWQGLGERLHVDEWDDWLTDAVAGWQALLDTFKGGLGGTLADIPTALNNAGQGVRDAIVQALGGSGTGHTAADVIAALQNIPQAAVDGLHDLATETNQIIEILAGGAVTAINSTVQAVKDWFHQWFGGGSQNAIPLSQKGTAWGVATLDGNSRIPVGNMPLDYIGGDSEIGKPTYVLLALAADQEIPNATETTLTGWTQVAGAAVTLTGGSSFPLPSGGWWHVEAHVVWDPGTSGARQAALMRSIAGTPTVVDADGAAVADSPFWAPRQALVGMQDMTNTSPLTEADPLSVRVYQNAGAARSVKGGGYPNGTYLLAVRRGDKDVVAATSRLYVCSESANQVYKVDASGTATAMTFTGLNAPKALWGDAAGNIYVADTRNKRVVKMTPTGVQSTLGFTGLGGSATGSNIWIFGITVDSDGSVYVIDDTFDQGRIVKLTSAGTQTVWKSGLEEPGSLAVGPNGNIFVCLPYQGVQEYTPSGTFVEGHFPSVIDNTYRDVYVAADGKIYVTDLKNRVVKMKDPSTNAISTLPAGFSGTNNPGHVAVDPTGSVFVTESGANRVNKLAVNNAYTVFTSGIIGDLWYG